MHVSFRRVVFISLLVLSIALPPYSLPQQPAQAKANPAAIAIPAAAGWGVAVGFVATAIVLTGICVYHEDLETALDSGARYLEEIGVRSTDWLREKFASEPVVCPIQATPNPFPPSEDPDGELTEAIRVLSQTPLMIGMQLAFTELYARHGIDLSHGMTASVLGQVQSQLADPSSTFAIEFNSLLEAFAKLLPDIRSLPIVVSGAKFLGRLKECFTDPMVYGMFLAAIGRTSFVSTLLLAPPVLAWKGISSSSSFQDDKATRASLTQLGVSIAGAMSLAAFYVIRKPLLRNYIGQTGFTHALACLNQPETIAPTPEEVHYLITGLTQLGGTLALGWAGYATWDHFFPPSETPSIAIDTGK